MTVINVYAVGRNTQEWRAALKELLSEDVIDGSGRDVAIRALTGAEDAHMLVAYALPEDRCVGAGSYRLTDTGIKRINTGSLARGAGSAVVEWQLCAHPGLPMWCKSVPAAWGFCEKLGMRNTETLANGWALYRWSASEAADWLNARSGKRAAA